MGADQDTACATDLGLPEGKGTYVLITEVTRMKRLEIGRLGPFDIAPGFYAYVGSACGAGGLRARIEHHLVPAAAPHWHIDYLLQWASPREVWFALSDRKLEQAWADLLRAAPSFRQPIPRFGSSDYRRSRTSHLFFTRRRPAFAWFEQTVRREFDAGVVPHRHRVVPTIPTLSP
jgi:Uri superfamily endonuclease